MMTKPLGPQFKDHDEDEDGPYCNNCSTDMGETLEWSDIAYIHPSNRIPCKGCGTIEYK